MTTNNSIPELPRKENVAPKQDISNFITSNPGDKLASKTTYERFEDFVCNNYRKIVAYTAAATFFGTVCAFLATTPIPKSDFSRIAESNPERLFQEETSGEWYFFDLGYFAAKHDINEGEVRMAANRYNKIPEHVTFKGAGGLEAYVVADKNYAVPTDSAYNNMVMEINGIPSPKHAVIK